MDKMTSIRLERYTPDMAGRWDEFVSASRNATFLTLRRYMDYHADRFADHSLVAMKNGSIVALLPANEIRRDDGAMILQSHGGLTYGGWILPPRHVDAADVLTLFNLLREYSLDNGIRGIDYKPLPYIYAAMPSDDDRYALFRQGARLTECNISATIDLSDNPGFNTLQRRNMKKALKAGVEIVADADIAAFHALLSRCLAERHGVSPVHTSAELEMLRNRFPERIRAFMAVGDGEALAGVCMFYTGRVAHAQYICSSGAGREKGALTLLFDYIIGKETEGCRYFDFGICNERHGEYLNEGLYRQKSGLGGSGVAYERYYLDFAD